MITTRTARGALIVRLGIIIALAITAVSAAVADDYNYYFGNTHSHTYYSDGAGTPTDHYHLAKACGYDFYAVTDHSQMLTALEYSDTKQQADTCTDDTFVAIAGFEYTASAGHIAVLNSQDYLNASQPGVNLPVLYDWLTTNQPTPVAAEFAHPDTWSFDNYAYLTALRRDGVTMYEMINLMAGDLHYSGFLTALNKGWRVAPVAAEDGHGTNRIASDEFRTGVLATSLTRESILQAMRARRVYCTWDSNLRLAFSANGQIMGSVLQKPSALSFSISATDPDTSSSGDCITRIEIVGDNGVLVDSQTFSAHSVTWDVACPAVYNYYFARVWTADKGDGPTAYSAPIWTGNSAQPLVAPLFLSATPVTTSRICISWTGYLAGVNGFRIERRIGADGVWNQIGIVGRTTLGYGDVGLMTHMTYYYRIRAYNDAGDLPYTNIASATTLTAISGRSEGVIASGSALKRDNQPFVPIGFTMVGLLSPTMDGIAGIAGEHYGQAELDAARAWKTNTIRFPISQRGFDPTDSLYSAAYVQRVKDGVALARRNGFVVILAMQDKVLSGGDATPMPEPQTLRSWDEVARLFNGDLGIIYELWDKPCVGDSATEWGLWRSGGTLNGETVIGHQQLVDLVRASGASNVLIANGACSGRSFAGCPGLSDSRYQIAYGIHPYLISPILDPANWDSSFGNWSDTHPVLGTEWCADSGNSSCQAQWPTLSPQLLDYLWAHNIGMTALAFDIPGTLVTDWSWNPTSFNGYTCGVAGCGPGELLKQRFDSYTTAQSVTGDSLGLHLKDTKDNSLISLSGVVVSEQLNNQQANLNYVYVQSKNRTAALKAMMPQAMSSDVFSPGEVLDLSGYLDSESEAVSADGSATWGDRVLHVTECHRNGTVAAPVALLMRNRSVVGNWAAGEHQQGAYHNSGLNNLGLYARVVGSITYIATNPSSGSISYFYVDDGSNLMDGTMHVAGSTPTPNIGLRIVAPSWMTNVPPPGFAVGAKAAATGCTALELVGQGGDNGIAVLRIADMGRATVY